MIGELKKSALESLRGNWGKAIGAVLVMYFVTVGLLGVLEIVLYGGFDAWSESLDKSNMNIDLIVNFASLLLVPLTIATSWLFLDLYRKSDVEVSGIFGVYKDANLSVKLILATLVQGIYIFLWTLLLLIPGFIKSYSYSQMFFILRDNPEMGINEAITESRKRMDGKKGKLFLLHLSFVGWFILSIFTLGIGLIWVIPYMNATVAAFYDEHIA